MQGQGTNLELSLISNLNKEATSLRLDIQKLHYALEAEKEINRELSTANSNLQYKLSESHKKAISLQERLNLMSENYEIQIEELKILVETRSEELEELSRQILPKMDEDMLRIRLINELEIPHREEMDDLAKDLSRLQSEVLEAQKGSEVLEAKLQHTEKIKQQELSDTRKEYTDSLIQNRMEIEAVTQQNVRDVEYIRKLKKDIEELKSRQGSLKEKHMLEIEELHKENNKTLMNYGSDHELRNIRFELDQKGREVREEKEEVNRLRRVLESKNEELTRLEHDYNGLREESQELKDINDTYHRNNLQLKLDVERIQAFEVEVRSLKKEIGLKHQENSILVEKVKMLEGDKRVTQSMRLKQQAQGVGLSDKESAKLKNRILQLEDILEVKEQELAKSFRATDTRRNDPKARSPDRGLRDKLKEANSKIVQLLKEKVVLKQQLSELQRR